MTEQLPKWQQAIREQSNAENSETADMLIETVNSLLEESTAEVLRQLSSELNLNMRGIRGLAYKIQHECDPHIKTTHLFKTVEDGQEVTVNVEQFSERIVTEIAEGRQLADLLLFYAMALSETDN